MVIEQVYYTTGLGKLAGGLYALDIKNGTETHYDIAKELPEGAVGNVYVCFDEVYVNAIKAGNVFNYRMDSSGQLREWNCDQFLIDAATVPHLNYLYTSDGTTIDIETGEVLGTWVFE